MDWTGGVRRRFAAGKNNANMLKQKQHFAKARAALQHTPSSYCAFKPAYLASEADDDVAGSAVHRTRAWEAHISPPKRCKYHHEDAGSRRSAAYATGGGHTRRPAKEGYYSRSNRPEADRVSQPVSYTHLTLPTKRIV